MTLTDQQPFYKTLTNNSPEYHKLRRIAKKYEQHPSAITARHYELLSNKDDIYNILMRATKLRLIYRLLTGRNRAQLNDLCNLLTITQERSTIAYVSFLFNLTLMLEKEYDTQAYVHGSKFYEYANINTQFHISDTLRGSQEQQKIYRIAKCLKTKPEYVSESLVAHTSSPQLTWQTINAFIKLEDLLQPVSLMKLFGTINSCAQAFDDFERCLLSIGLKYNESVDNC